MLTLAPAVETEVLVVDSLELLAAWTAETAARVKTTLENCIVNVVWW